jgi:hypothetical protein
MGASVYGHAAEVARLVQGYHLTAMTERDDTGSLELKEQQGIRAREEERAARDAEQPSAARAHERRADKASYLRDKLAEAEQADREAQE